jgi:hypothetical protein
MRPASLPLVKLLFQRYREDRRTYANVGRRFGVTRQAVWKQAKTHDWEGREARLWVVRLFDEACAAAIDAARAASATSRAGSVAPTDSRSSGSDGRGD